VPRHIEATVSRTRFKTIDLGMRNTSCILPAILVSLVVFVSLQSRVFAQTNPNAVANITHQTYPQVTVTVISNYLYYAPYGPPNTLVYDITNPTNPVYLANTSIPGQAGNAAYLYGCLPIAVAGRYAYVASSDLSVVDISNPTNLLTVGAWHSDIGPSNSIGIATALDVAVSGNYVYLADGCDGLYVFDVSIPARLIQVGHTNDLGAPTDQPSYAFGYEGSAVGVAVSGNYAFVANWLDGLRVYDVSNPSHPVNVGRVADPAYSITISGGLAYVFTARGAVNIYGLSDPSHPMLVGQITGWALGSLALSGNFVFVDSVFQSVSIYDVSNPAHPLQVGHTDDLSGPGGWAYEAYSIALSHNYLYVGLRDYGVRIYALGSPSPPKLSITITNTSNLLLSWPAPTSAFVAQQNSGINSANWLTLTNESALVGPQNQVTIPKPPGSMFYRLVSR
jgi:hypothetical protein